MHLYWWLRSRWLAEVWRKASQRRIQGTLNLSWLQVSFTNGSPPGFASMGISKFTVNCPKRLCDPTCSPLKTLRNLRHECTFKSLSLTRLRNSVQGCLCLQHMQVFKLKRNHFYAEKTVGSSFAKMLSAAECEDFFVSFFFKSQLSLYNRYNRKKIRHSGVKYDKANHSCTPWWNTALRDQNRLREIKLLIHLMWSKANITNTLSGWAYIFL